jgi:hypothetical protein
VFLAGCASGPPFKEVSASFPALAPDKGRIFFYRPSAAGAAVKPDVNLNGQVVGSSVSHGFFFVDRPAGDYKVSTTTEVEKTLTFHLDRGQTRYVRLNISMGFMVGHVYPTLAEPDVGKKEIEQTKSIVTK